MAIVVHFLRDARLSIRMTKNLIIIRDLKLNTVIGVKPWEKHLPQTLLLDLEIEPASSQVFVSDTLTDGIDYVAVVARIREYAQTHRCLLLERFAETIAKIVLSEFAAMSVMVSVRKPAVLPDVREIGVAITRRKKSNI